MKHFLAIPAGIGALVFLSLAQADIGFFTNIEKERSVMISRDAMNDFVKDHQATDPDFHFVREVRAYYGSTVAIDVYPEFLELNDQQQEKLIRKILDSWAISLPDHLKTAAVEVYVTHETDPYISRRILKY